MGLFSTKTSDSDIEMTSDFHFPTSKKALIIFTRNPELGKCKTRLAVTIGDENALEVYKYLIKHTAKISKDVIADKYVFYSENIKNEDIWDASTFRKKLQEGEDLGERMHNAFQELFDIGYEKVIIIGSDLLDLDSDLINNSFGQLNSFEFVIGPAKDGGYYLLGMNQFQPELFINKAWGTSTVLSNTLEDLQSRNIHLLKELNDIDTFEDMEHYEQLKKFYSIQHD